MEQSSYMRLFNYVYGLQQRKHGKVFEEKQEQEVGEGLQGFRYK